MLFRSENIKECNGDEIVLGVLRNNEKIKVRIKPVKSSNGSYKIGIWVRDSAQGIGTMTFVDENGNFGALGHGINDIDTNTLMDLNYGGIYHTQIVDITKGSQGSPGELTGIIDFKESNVLGSITKNTNKGIFGNLDMTTLLNENPEAKALDIALKQEIQVGSAQIYCKIENEIRS